MSVPHFRSVTPLAKKRKGSRLHSHRASLPAPCNVTPLAGARVAPHIVPYGILSAMGVSQRCSTWSHAPLLQACGHNHSMFCGVIPMPAFAPHTLKCCPLKNLVIFARSSFTLFLADLFGLLLSGTQSSLRQNRRLQSLLCIYPVLFYRVGQVVQVGLSYNAALYNKAICHVACKQ